MDKKKIIFIIIFILVTILLGYLIYRVFFYEADENRLGTPTTSIPGITDIGTFPQADEGGKTTTGGQKPGTLPTAGIRLEDVTRPEEKLVEKTIDLPVVSPSSDSVGDARFYNDIDGKFYRLDKSGQVETLSDEIFYNVESVTWSPVNDQAVIEYPDGANIYYNFEDQEQITLPRHWQDFSFSPSGDKIASKNIGISPENQWLITSNANGRSVKLIEPMGDNASKVNIDWSPNRQIVATSRTGDALGADREEILLVGLQGENFKSLVVEGRGMQSKWSTEGKKMLYSVYSERSDFKPELWVVNAYGDKIGTGRSFLNLNTWAEKCTFESERFLYCAVPTQLDRGAAFAPALYENMPDEIYKIDLQTGIKTQIPISDDKTVKDMFLSPDKQNLYFTDTSENGLFKIDL